MDNSSMQRAEPGPASRPVLQALRKAGGRVTVGDAMAATGLPQDQVESTLHGLLETRRGHLEVGETGTLVYRFDPRLIQRDAEPLLARAGRKIGAGLREAFKVWIVLMLVVYFVVFVVLLLAALVAGQSREGGRSRGRGFGLGGRRGGGFPSFWFWYFFWRPGWGWRRPYYGHRWERRYAGTRGESKVPFIKKVFAFVFGPDSPRPSQAQKDRSVIRLIRARKGVLTAAELVQHTGLPLQEAEEEMARLMGAYAGDVKVTPNGVLTYVFPDLMVSAAGTVTEREPDPAWRRLEPAASVTGNDSKSNALIGGLNGFNLVAAMTAPWFIFPRLGFGGPLAWIGLVWIPAVFSALFFAIPLLRSIAVRRRNRKRQETNLRKILLGHVLRATLSGQEAGWVTAAGARERTRSLLPAPGAGARRTRQEPAESNLPAEPQWEPGFLDQLQRLTAEFDGEVEEMPDGIPRYRFPQIRTEFRGAEEMRHGLRLDRRSVGEIVYASDETEEEADRREVEAFDREIRRQDDLERYLQSPDRVGYLDEFELVAFDEELRRGRAISA